MRIASLSGSVPALIVSLSASAGLTLVSPSMTATGVYAGSEPFTASFTFTGDLNASAAVADFGDWDLSLFLGGSLIWTVAASDTVGGSWRNVAGGQREFTVTLFDATGDSSGDSGSLTPAPTEFRIRYTAVRNGSSVGTLGQALLGSQGDSLRGDFTVETSGASGDGSVQGPYLVPSPGSAVLLAAATLIAQRRRTA
jgi:hypothetical protein